MLFNVASVLAVEKKMQPSMDAACNLDVAGETTGVSETPIAFMLMNKTGGLGGFLCS